MRRLTKIILLVDAIVGMVCLFILLPLVLIFSQKNQSRQTAYPQPSSIPLPERRQKPKTKPKPASKPKEDAVSIKNERDKLIKKALWEAIKNRVTDRLKSPATADFHDGIWEGKQGPEQNVTVDGNVYTVRGYVDSQNGFGALLRTDFSIKFQMTETGTGTEWKVTQPLDFNHELENAAIQAKEKESRKEIDLKWLRKEMVWNDTTVKVMEQLTSDHRHIPGEPYTDHSREGYFNFVTEENGIFSVNGTVDLTRSESDVNEPGARYHFKFSRKVRFTESGKIKDVEPLKIE